jgi:putative ABC transport system permease protein
VCRSRQADADFSAELEAHIALDTDEGIRSGLTPAEARRQALLRLGGAEQTRQALRDRRTLPWLESLIQDTRYGLRTLRRTPGFTVTAVLTLAVGIGACTAVFSLVNAVLIRSLPYGDPQRLVYLFTPSPTIHIPTEAVCPGYADFFDIKRQSHSYANMTAYEQTRFGVTAQRGAERIGAAKVDADFFTTLQSMPALGRAISADDSQPGHSHVAVISHSLWLQMFAGRSDILQRSIELDGSSYRIIGVMQPEFEYPFKSDLPYGDTHIESTRIWVPLVLSEKEKAVHDINDDVVVARLKPDATIQNAQAELSTLMAQLDKLHGGEMNDWGAQIEGFLNLSVGPVRPLMLLLLGAVCMVLLIACGNAANLLLARSANRMRELGVRVALGAGRNRIVRQLMTESLLIGIAAGVIGICFAFLFLRVLPMLDPGNIPRLNEASLDARVLLFTTIVSLLTSLLSGIFPAAAVSRVNLTDFLASAGGRSVAGGGTRMQSVLVVLESALVVVLLVGAGLLIRSYINVESVNTGFSESTVTTNIEFDQRYSQPPQRTEFLRNLLHRLQGLPGVQAVGAVDHLPLSNTETIGFFAVQGYPNKKDQMAEGRSVTSGYFSAMGIPLLAGRLFTDADKPGSQHEVIVNESFAREYFAGRNPVGGKVSPTDPQESETHYDWSTVIGVIADVRHTSLEEAATPQIYSLNDPDGGFVALRSSLPAKAAATEMRDALRALDPDLAVGEIKTMGDLVSAASARRRFQVSLLTVFAGIALFLALVGLYGLMAYSVSTRTREVGIRMALGAQRSDVMLLVVRKAALLLTLGLCAGVFASWFATRALNTFLFGVQQHDLVTTASVCVLLAVCGLPAALLPARRAASIDPIEALRTE